jgi:hypothetical protein
MFARQCSLDTSHGTRSSLGGSATFRANGITTEAGSYNRIPCASRVRASAGMLVFSPTKKMPGLSGVSRPGGLAWAFL